MHGQGLGTIISLNTLWIPFVLEQVLREMQLEPGSWLDDAKNGMLTLLERLGEPVVKGEDPKTGCDTLLGIILMARGVAGLPDDLFLSGLLGRPSDLPHVKLNPFLSNETSLNFKVWSDLENDLDLGSETTFSLLCPPSHGPKLLGVYDLIVILSKNGKSIARRGFHVTLDAEVQLKPAFIPNGTMPYTHNFLLSAVPPDTFIEDLDGWIVAGGQDIDAFYGPASGARWTPQKWKLLVESMPQPNAEL
ncbi:hypothetical protein MPSEU_001039500 [Mayamaea pseudoterrestris]|nr:hypothetical protein MPSEU_001039500 [Mayamaea pseudoterrestris]